MRFQGLVFLVLLVMNELAVAQSGPPPAEQTFLPPSPQKLDASEEPATLPSNPATLPSGPAPVPPSPTIVEARQSTNMEAELQQFRNELREFQMIREDVARSTKATDAAADSLSTHQRQELMEMLTKLATKRLTRRNAGGQNQPIAEQPVRPAQPVESPTPNAAPGPADSIDIAEPFALGKVLFRQGDFAGAEKAFRKTIVNSENEMTLKYLLATCLRRQSRWQPAIEAYKVVAESNQDPVLRDLAKWQLDNIRWHQQSESQLEQMRQQREKRLEAPNSPAASKAGSRQ